MDTKFFVLFALLFAVIVVFGCIGGEKQVETQANASPETKDLETAEMKERPIYVCPLDKSKIDYNCETDEDCKLVTCRSGAGDIDTCMNINSEYEGVQSGHCVCKVTGSYTTYVNGTETTEYIKNCRFV